MKGRRSAKAPETRTDNGDLAPGWYVAGRSTDVYGPPRAVLLAGREYVTWRTHTQQPVVMARFCPHQGAALDLGKVTPDGLRCAFHHWQFAPNGTCVAAPSTRRVPRDVAVEVLPVWEGLGFVWVWLGTPEPLYPSPTFAPFDSPAGPFRSYAFKHHTSASPRRILENGFDLPHFPIVHGIDADLNLIWGAPSGPHEIVGSIETDSLRLPRVIRSLVSIGRLALRLRSTASYQTLTFELDGMPAAYELLALTPLHAHSTVMRGWTVLPRSRSLLGSAPAFWAYRTQHHLGTLADLRIYRHVTEVGSSVNTSKDEGVLRYRKFYRVWQQQGADRASNFH